MVDDPVVFYFCASTGTHWDVELFIPVFEVFRESKWTRAGCFQLCKLFWEMAAGFLISFFCIVRNPVRVRCSIVLELKFTTGVWQHHKFLCEKNTFSSAFFCIKDLLLI